MISSSCSYYSSGLEVPSSTVVSLGGCNLGTASAFDLTYDYSMDSFSSGSGDYLYFYITTGCPYVNDCCISGYCGVKAKAWRGTFHVPSYLIGSSLYWYASNRNVFDDLYVSGTSHISYRSSPTPTPTISRSRSISLSPTISLSPAPSSSRPPIPAPQPQPQSQESHKRAVCAAVAAAILVIACICCVLFVFCFRRRQPAEEGTLLLSVQ